MSKIKFNFDQLNDYYILMGGLDFQFNLVEALHREPETYLSDYLDKFLQETELRRALPKQLRSGTLKQSEIHSWTVLPTLRNMALVKWSN